MAAALHGVILDRGLRDYNSTPPKVTPSEFKELIRIIWLNRVLNRGGDLWGGGGGVLSANRSITQ